MILNFKGPTEDFGEFKALMDNPNLILTKIPNLKGHLMGRVQGWVIDKF